MAKVKIEHELMDSKVATAVALFNEWLKWCEANNIDAFKANQIPKLFEHTKSLRQQGERNE